MITFDNKQILVTGVEAQYAQIHYVQALGTSVVEIEDLRATTIQELEDVLLNAPRVSLAGQEVQCPQGGRELADPIGAWGGDDDGSEGMCSDLEGEGAYRPSAAEVERSELQGDRIAMFRAEY